MDMSQQIIPMNSTASLVQALSLLSGRFPVDNQNKFDGNQPDDSVEGAKKRRKSNTKRTRIACLPCALSKSACHAERPCARCVRLNMADQCVNRVHRKMGRPRRHHSTRLVEVDMLHHSLNKPVVQSTPIRVSSALWASWRSTISVCCEQKLVAPKYACVTSLLSQHKFSKIFRIIGSGRRSCRSFSAETTWKNTRSYARAVIFIIQKPAKSALYLACFRDVLNTFLHLLSALMFMQATFVLLL